MSGMVNLQTEMHHLAFEEINWKLEGFSKFCLKGICVDLFPHFFNTI
jgi:hypothetical protein